MTSPNDIEVTVGRKNLNQKILGVSYTLILFNMERMSLYNIPRHFDYFWTFTSSSVSNDIFFANITVNFGIPTFFNNSGTVSSGFEGNCIIAYEYFETAGNLTNYMDRGMLFDSDVIPIGNFLVDIPSR